MPIVANLQAPPLRSGRRTFPSPSVMRWLISWLIGGILLALIVAHTFGLLFIYTVIIYTVIIASFLGGVASVGCSAFASGALGCWH
jgi:hypothetical protein